MLEEFSCQDDLKFQVSLSSCLMMAPVALSVCCSNRSDEDVKLSKLLSYVINFRVDEEGSVLLHRGLDQVGREAVPDQIHQGVLRCDVLLVLVHLRVVVPRHVVTRPDGHNQDDAQNDCQHGGGHVVEDGAESNFSREREIHGS